MTDDGDVAPSGWDLRRERIARHIEGAALELFAANRADDVTIEQIAAAAGVSKRTFFRYFASRDDVLAALPDRALVRMSGWVRARPADESLLQAFAAAGRTGGDADEDDDLLLRWGQAVVRSPDAAIRAMSRSAVNLEETFRVLAAERLQLRVDDPRASVLGVAIASVVAFTYRDWVLDEGRQPLGKLLSQAFETLRDLDAAPPVDPPVSSRPSDQSVGTGSHH
ncbi:MAG TPA: TetR family transcriptional regulator [Acidimicrobiia bacterium]|nr:TetR family transcriptional regulator [Acidimicrobiia bacterium]